MDPAELAAMIGAVLGGGFTAAALVIGLGWKLWQGMKKIAKTTGGTEEGLVKALGIDDVDNEEGPRRRRQTGSFQAMVREELDQHLGPLGDSITSIEAISAENAEQIRGLADGQRRQGELIADLARGHATVVVRTAEHSAKLSMAEATSAAETMTNGRKPT